MIPIGIIKGPTEQFIVRPRPPSTGLPDPTLRFGPFGMTAIVRRVLVALGHKLIKGIPLAFEV
jgi:hypothetical protein